MDRKLLLLADRVLKLETMLMGSGKPGGSSEDDRHKYTLVYGGWPRESSRKDILRDLNAALSRLDLQGLRKFLIFPRTTLPRCAGTSAGASNYCGRLPTLPSLRMLDDLSFSEEPCRGSCL